MKEQFKEENMPGVKTIATYPAEEILELVDENAVFKTTVSGATMIARLGSVRLRTFKKSNKCVCCGRVGNIMGLDLPIGQNKPHFNLYCHDESNYMVLMTKDHIIPKSKGGKNHISNMQTMCRHCNLNKGDKSPEEYASFLTKKNQPSI